MSGKPTRDTPNPTVSRLADVRESEASSQTARATLALREMLVQGRLRPGEKIREVPLSEQLKISRIPLHLALERMANEVFSRFCRSAASACRASRWKISTIRSNCAACWKALLPEWRRNG